MNNDLTDEQIWGNYGRVLNPKTKKYVRIGDPKSLSVIYNLEHNDEWNRRVEYMIGSHCGFGKKLEIYLQNKLLKT
jgi:hypothetical protein